MAPAEDLLASEKNEKHSIKVTDKRLFTADGDIREEFQQEIRPAEGDPMSHAAPPAAAPEPPRAEPPADTAEPRRERDRGGHPGTQFASFVEQLVVQAYMSLGMIRSPYGDVPVDPGAAKQMIDILGMLQEKTAGNLSVEEADFLQTHLGELKLAWVRQSKSI